MQADEPPRSAAASRYAIRIVTQPGNLPEIQLANQAEIPPGAADTAAHAQLPACEPG